jgi:hypothetical protein
LPVQAGRRFRVVLVDARPQLEGRLMLKRLIKRGIPCVYVLLNAISCVISVRSACQERHPCLNICARLYYSGPASGKDPAQNYGNLVDQMLLKRLIKHGYAPLTNAAWIGLTGLHWGKVVMVPDSQLRPWCSPNSTVISRAGGAANLVKKAVKTRKELMCTAPGDK